MVHNIYSVYSERISSSLSRYLEATNSRGPVTIGYRGASNICSRDIAWGKCQRDQLGKQLIARRNDAC